MNGELMDVGKLLDSFRRLAEQEARRDARADSDSTTRSTRAASAASDAEGRVLRAEWLRKQGGRVKSWHGRFFVLRRSGLYYFRDESQYRCNQPLGRIMFCDMVALTGSGKVAQTLPISIHLLLGLKYVFCVHTETRTYTIAAPSRDSQQAWVLQVNSAWERFHSQYRRKNALLGEVWRVGGDQEIYAMAQELTKTNTDVTEVLDNMLDAVNDQFAADVARLHAKRALLRCWAAWKAYMRYEAAARDTGARQTYERTNPRSFFSSKRRSVTNMLAKRVGLA